MFRIGVVLVMDDDLWYSFADNEGCDDDCRGWDGESPRCDCGNRRVYWDCVFSSKCACKLVGDKQKCENAYPQVD
jgi:hypothetical protein